MVYVDVAPTLQQFKNGIYAHRTSMSIQKRTKTNEDEPRQPLLNSVHKHEIGIESCILALPSFELRPAQVPHRTVSGPRSLHRNFSMGERLSRERLNIQGIACLRENRMPLVICDRHTAEYGHYHLSTIIHHFILISNVAPLRLPSPIWPPPRECLGSATSIIPQPRPILPTERSLPPIVIAYPLLLAREGCLQGPGRSYGGHTQKSFTTALPLM